MKKCILGVLLCLQSAAILRAVHVQDIDPQRARRLRRAQVLEECEGCQGCEEGCQECEEGCRIADSRPMGNVDYNPWYFGNSYKQYYVMPPYHGYFNYGSSFARIKRY